MIKLSIFNVPVMYTEDDLYDHFCSTNIDIVNLRQTSHLEARRKSFVVTVHRSMCKAIINNDILSYLRIGVREYEERRYR